MKVLLDTNIFLEIILSQEKAKDAKNLLLKSAQHEFFITDYSLHSIGLLLFRRKQYEAFQAFVQDVLVNGGIRLLSLHSNDMESVILSAQKFNLDFDDAYQYSVASKYEITLSSFDSDFQRTERGYKTPLEILQVIP
jgi:predicted nucleic acid-binding protein